MKPISALERAAQEAETAKQQAEARAKAEYLVNCKPNGNGNPTVPYVAGGKTKRRTGTAQSIDLTTAVDNGRIDAAVDLPNNSIDLTGTADNQQALTRR